MRKEEGCPDQGWQGHPVVVVSATIGRGRHFPETRALALALHEDWLAASTAPSQYPCGSFGAFISLPYVLTDMLVLLAANYSPREVLAVRPPGDQNANCAAKKAHPKGDVERP